MNPDNRLGYPPDAILPLIPWGAAGGVFTGSEPAYYEQLPAVANGQIDRSSGNRVILPRNIGTENFKLAVEYIIGMAAGGRGLGGGGLFRTLPVSDGQGLGMVANRVVGFHLIGDTGKRLQPGNVQIPDAFDYAGGGPPDTTTTAFKGRRYCRLDVEFWHPPYVIQPDSLVPISLGGQGELLRYCWSEFIDAFEFNTSKALICEWDAGAPVTPGRPIADGPGFPRPTGELVIHWERVPNDAWVQLLAKYINNSYQGKINSVSFDAPFYDRTVTFPAEYLMFMSCRPHLRWQPHGPVEYDLEFHFQCKFNGGWNFFQEPIKGGFQRLRRQADRNAGQLPGTGADIWQQFNFRELFLTSPPA